MFRTPTAKTKKNNVNKRKNWKVTDNNQKRKRMKFQKNVEKNLLMFF